MRIRLLTACIPLPLTAQAQTPAYDIAIRNGRVLDGWGNLWIRGAVAIEVVNDHGKHTGARPGKVLYGTARETEHANTR